MKMFALFLSVAFLPIAFSQLEAGQPFVLVQCGKYPQYQQYSLIQQNNNVVQIDLTAYTNSCIDCAGCSGGAQPHVWGCFDTNSASYPNQEFELSDPSNTLIKSVGYTTTRTCLTFAYNLEFQEGLMEFCKGDISSGQNFTYDSDGYFRLYANKSLCLTAFYFTPPSCDDKPYSTYEYCNQTLPTEIRVNDLVSRMNYIEKIQILENNNAGVLRLGFPPIRYNEALHGVVVGCGAKTANNPDGGGCPTSFPHAELLGATYNRSLWRHIGEAISDEARALNNQGYCGLSFWAPDINLCRDPRWGRCQEVPGEDPFLTGQYVMQYSKHMQFGIDKKYLKVVSTAKHYADYDQEGNYGTNRGDFNAIVTDRDQVEYYWPAFRSAVQTANIQSSMCSYNGVNGYPSCGHDYFVNQVMREEWGFEGFFVSDCGAITDGFFNEYVRRNLHDSNSERIEFAISSGCDAECGSAYNNYGPTAYENGILTDDTLNRAVKRVLSKSFDLGVLDTGVYYTSYGPEYIDSDYHRKLALNAAEQGIVLLKNDNNILPLKSDYSQTVAVIGPHANSSSKLLSIYVGGNNLVKSHTPWLVIKNLIGDNAQYSLGCNLTCLSTNGFSDAVNIAQKADIALVFLGLLPGREDDDPNQDVAREDEGWDRDTFEFPGNQLELLKQVSAANKNTILVLINGGTIDVSYPKSSTNVPGIIEAFYPGELGGDAIMNIIYGNVSPAGKLPLTVYPQSMAEARNIMDMNLQDNGGITYRYYQGTPVYEFGYGLSYTNFTYVYYPNNETSIKYNTKKLADFYRNGHYFYREAVSYKIGVTNVGNMDSDCVVLGFLYSNNTDSPQKKLFDFERVFVPMGQTVNVTLSISPESISLTNKYGNERIVPGEYKLTFGDHKNIVTAKLYLYGKEESIFNLPEIREKYIEKMKKKMRK